MKISPYLLSFVVALSGSAFASSDAKIVGHMEPLPYERLENPIALTELCSEVKIVEWRGTSGSLEETSPNDKSLEVINDACNLALSFLPAFAKDNGFKLDNHVTFRANIALMPADIHNQGKDYRNLNDINYRFKYRDLKFVKYIWGYASDSGYIYMRNDVLINKTDINQWFVVVFVHELWHMISFQYGIFDRYSGDKYAKDEMIANKFVEYLKLN